MSCPLRPRRTADSLAASAGGHSLARGYLRARCRAKRTYLFYYCDPRPAGAPAALHAAGAGVAANAPLITVRWYFPSH